ncbi:MAG: cobyric acid synthase [bacterium]
MSGKAKAIMVQGTGSGVGKSVLVAALCFIFREKGIKVAPFKAQNMSLNSFVTTGGHEMGRAQVYQAEASGLEPDVRMNPILIKPSADNCSQVILMGKPAGNSDAKNYYGNHERHREIVRRAYDSLAAEYNVIVLEGAGSPAEINLQQRDVVNMSMAEHAAAGVLIVGDIDKGGVFAWMKGTFDLVQPRHRTLIKGFLINKFRGDVSLLEPGIRKFEKMVKRRVLGVIPYSHDLMVDEEDAVPIILTTTSTLPDHVTIGVVYLPRMSNFTDFIPLAREPDVSLCFARSPNELDKCDCVIIPGSKATLADAVVIKQAGWFEKIRDLHRRGVAIVGVCGGYQMLGRKILDPHGIESEIAETDGLGLLPIVSRIEGDKILRRVERRMLDGEIFDDSCLVRGYEIHMGRTDVAGEVALLVDSGDEPLCVSSPDHSVIGTYFHGFFDDDATRRAFINQIRQRKGLNPLGKTFAYAGFRREQFEKLASLVENHCDMDEIYGLIA